MDVRYDFGRNWSELAAHLDETHLEKAKHDLERLAGEIRNSRFLDIGCGSGIHSAAALSLGAESVYALDYDPICVATTRAMLQRFALNSTWTVEQADVLNRDSLPKQTFDIVYSWGVLHHTGDMWRAIRNATELVAPDGTICLALYLRTPLCSFWQTEKKLYAQMKWLRPLLKWPYICAFLLRRQMVSGDAFSYVRNYRDTRGMEFLVDVDDWLGGFPYESVVPEELVLRMQELGFGLCASFNTQAGRGIFGTGCGEWRFKRI